MLWKIFNVYLSCEALHFFKIMSKRLKFNSLKATRNEIKDNSIKNQVNHENDATVSKYFVAEVLEPKKRGVPKKRRSIEIQYENNSKNKEKNEELGAKNNKLNKKSVKKEGKNVKNEEKNVKNEAKNDKNDEKNVKNVEDKDNQVNEGVKWSPENWEKTLELIKEMRKHHTAPVDEMGCHKCSDTEATPSIYRFQSLLALMLSSQTKDQVTHAAMERLRAYGCTPEVLVVTPDNVLEKLIHPVGFFKRKVQYIKRTCEILLRDYKGDIPETIEGLCALPGVGPKMGHICMQVAWNKVTGIGVDTHVHRISNRLNWVRKQAKNPEETRKQLEEWLPRDLWTEINHLLVGFGQEICLPQNPKCGQCLNREFCPFGRARNQ